MEGLLVSVNLLAAILTVSSQVHPDITLTTSVSHMGHVMKGETFHFNCTVSALHDNMHVEIYKSAYDVMPTAHIMYKLGSDWPQILVQDGQLSSALTGLSRYSVHHMMSADDNTTTTTVMITGIHTEDGGTWNARVVHNGTDVIHARNNTAIHVYVVAPVTTVRIFARAATGDPPIPALGDVILSDGDIFPMNADMRLKLICLVGIEGFTRANVAVNLTGADISSIDLTNNFMPMDMPSNQTQPGGLVTFTDDLHYVYDNFTPSVMHHGDVITCSAAQDGYPVMSAYFVMNVQSKPMVSFDVTKIVAKVGTSSVTVSCMVTANPAVTAANVTWSAPGTVNMQNDTNFVINTTPPDGKKTTSTLTIKNVKEEYYGTYMCTAMNSLGSTSAEIEAVETDSTASSANGCQATAAFGFLLSLVTAWISLP